MRIIAASTFSGLAVYCALLALMAPVSLSTIFPATISSFCTAIGLILFNINDDELRK